MAIHSIYTLSQDDPEARNWLSFFRRRGHTNLTNVMIERVVWLEGTFNLERLMPLLINPLYQVPAETSQLDPQQGPIVEIAYRPAVTDPETPSILAGAHALGESGLQFARLTRRPRASPPAFFTTKLSRGFASPMSSLPLCSRVESLMRLARFHCEASAMTSSWRCRANAPGMPRFRR
jgi:hypothetical protein